MTTPQSTHITLILDRSGSMSDITDDIIPLEAGIEDRAISLTKGCYVGQEVIIRVLHRGQGRVQPVQMSLRAFKCARHGFCSQVFLAGEMPVQTGLGDTHLSRDLIDGHGVKAFFRQQAVDGLDDGFLAGSQHLLLEGGLGGGSVTNGHPPNFRSRSA